MQKLLRVGITFFSRMPTSPLASRCGAPLPSAEPPCHSPAWWTRVSAAPCHTNLYQVNIASLVDHRFALLCDMLRFFARFLRPSRFQYSSERFRFISPEQRVEQNVCAVLSAMKYRPHSGQVLARQRHFIRSQTDCWRSHPNFHVISPVTPLTTGVPCGRPASASVSKGFKDPPGIMDGRMKPTGSTKSPELEPAFRVQRVCIDWRQWDRCWPTPLANDRDTREVAVS